YFYTLSLHDALPIYRVLLHDLVRLLAREAGLGELQQHALRVDQSVRALEVLRHADRVHLEALDDERGQVEDVVERDRRIRQHDALDRRVADVALVPQGDVLQRRRRVATQQTRQPADALGQPGVALVGP